MATEGQGIEYADRHAARENEEKRSGGLLEMHERVKRNSNNRLNHTLHMYSRTTLHSMRIVAVGR
jgi:hypothetical protein